MIVTASSTPNDFDGRRWSILDGQRFFVAWRGGVYERGLRMGAPTIERLVARLETRPFMELRRALHGVFVVFVFDRETQSWSVAVDNAGLYKAFYDDTSVSSSLLQLVAAGGKGIESVSPTAVADFVASMGVHWGDTLVSGIRTIGRDEVVELRPLPHEPLTVVRDGSADPEPPDPSDFVDYMADLGAAIEGLPTSVDLSGGLDSRLIACLLHDGGAEFEVAVSGRRGLPDIAISKRAANIIGHPCFVTEHDVSSIEDELEGLFYARDGNGDVLEYHRMGQLQAQRQARGVLLSVSGAGGEIFKDFWWLHDFPRYRSRQTNFGRFYDLRLAGIRLPDGLLAGDAAKAYARRRRETLDRFEAFRASTNTESYDRVFCLYQMPVEAGSILTAHTNNYFPALAPFLDHDNFLIGDSLARRKRAFNAFHREVLSARCPSLAALKTNTGVTARSGVGPSARDAAGHAANLARRLADKVGQRTRGKAFFWSSSDSPDLVSRAKASAAFAASIPALKNVGLIEPDLVVEEIPDALAGRLLTLGMLVRYMQGDLEQTKTEGG